MRYSDEVLRRVRDPQRVGTLDGDHVGTGEVGTLDEGTVVRIQVRAEWRSDRRGALQGVWLQRRHRERKPGGRVARRRGDGRGERLTPERVVQKLGLAPEREHVARMAVEAGA